MAAGLEEVPRDEAEAEIELRDLASRQSLVAVAGHTHQWRFKILLAAPGVPVVIAYTISIYWIFRGKVKLDRMSY